MEVNHGLSFAFYREMPQICYQPDTLSEIEYGYVLQPGRIVICLRLDGMPSSSVITPLHISSESCLEPFEYTY